MVDSKHIDSMAIVGQGVALATLWFSLLVFAKRKACTRIRDSPDQYVRTLPEFQPSIVSLPPIKGNPAAWLCVCQLKRVIRPFGPSEQLTAAKGREPSS